MASSLAAQLSQVALKSTNELDLKAQKTSHSQSLIFDPKTAGNQSFDTIYRICREGFEDLCQIDGRFVEYGASLFSEQSLAEDRTQMTASQNEELDRVIETFLDLLASKLLLKPAVKVVEWLIRRFRVHEYNTKLLLLTLLPHHASIIFHHILAILPSNPGPTFQFLQPYIRSLTLVPRDAIAYAATHNIAFFNALNDYVLHMCENHREYDGLLSFWVGVTTEAVTGMLNASKTGRSELQRQNEEDVFLRLAPMLKQAFKIPKSLQLRVNCYMVIALVVKNTRLSDTTICLMMETVVQGWSAATLKATLMCLSTLAAAKQASRLPRKVVMAVLRVEQLEDVISELSSLHDMKPLTLGLIDGMLHRLEKGKDLDNLPLIERLLYYDVLTGPAARSAIQSVVATAQNLPKNEDEFLDLRLDYGGMLKRLQGPELGAILQSVLEDCQITLSSLGLGIQSSDDSDDDDGEDEKDDNDVDDGLKSGVDDEAFSAAADLVPQRTEAQMTVLSSHKSHIFDALERAFLLAIKSSENVKRFQGLALFLQDEPDNYLFFSFFLRVLCSSDRPKARAIAADIIADNVSESRIFRPIFQAVFPYVIWALGDSSEAVRRSACKLMIALRIHYERKSYRWKDGEVVDGCEHYSNEANRPRKIKRKNLPGDDALDRVESDESDTILPFGEILNAIYNVSPDTAEIHSVQRDDMFKIIDSVFVPSLEEFAMDASRVGATVEQALRGKQVSDHQNSRTPTVHLEKDLRQELFLSLRCQLFVLPQYAVKLRLLSMLTSVEKVGSTSVGRSLLPLLKEWAGLPEIDVNAISTIETINVKELEGAMATIISSNDKETMGYWLTALKDADPNTRPLFLVAMLERGRTMWPDMKVDRQLAAAEYLLEGTLDTDSSGSSSFREVLNSVTLHSDVLVHLIDKVQDNITSLPDRPSPAKRRRTSQGGTTTLAVDNEEVILVMQKTTLILEVVESSRPENHPSLLGKLFDMLPILQRFKPYAQFDLAYAQTMLLGSLLTIAKRAKDTGTMKLDPSLIRGDLLVDCIRHTPTQQIQNTALLLMVNFASVAPTAILHNVMPIFTFMGANILKQNDAYSKSVVDQTIDEVITPLVQSLKYQKRDILAGTSELLLSFLAAFEHIPSDRRLGLFKALITKLGPTDFLFAILAMLAEKFKANGPTRSFATQLAAEFDTETRLISFQHYLALVEDSLKAKPTHAHILLGVGGEGRRDATNVVSDLLIMLTHLLRDSRLVEGVKKLLRNEKTSDHTRTLLSKLVEQTLGVMESSKDGGLMQSACSDTLSALLSTLSIVELIKAATELLRRKDDEFRRKILLLTGARLRDSSAKDPDVYTTALGFLPVLSEIIDKAQTPKIRHAAIACTDQICEKYGKKDILKVVEVAKDISKCLRQPDVPTQIISALSLASIINVLGEAAIPLLADAINQGFTLLQRSLNEDSKIPKLHNAAYALFAAILAELPGMMAATDSERLLKLSFEAANADLGVECKAIRSGVLQQFSRNVDLKLSIDSIDKKWDDAIQEGSKAVHEAVLTMQRAIEKASRSAINANSDRLSNLFLKAYDLRRTQHLQKEHTCNEDEIAQVEKALNETAIKLIFKMNDQSFRPIFVKLMEWAATGLPKSDDAGRALRLTTLYTFLEHFFDTLKSIVTSYASYTIDSSVSILKSLSLKDPLSLRLWHHAISTLTASFVHDQDEFWQSPAHFDPISAGLLSNLSAASAAPATTAPLTTAITTLAAATDSADQHKSINSALMKHMRSDSAAVRLAAVQIERALTERLGEEWLVLLSEMLPFIAELLEDDEERVEREARRWVARIEEILGESLETMLQ